MLPFLAAAILMELTPGPNMSWLAMLSATQGRRAGAMAVAGVSLGLTILAVAAAFGLTAAIGAFPAVYGFMRWAGVGFLVILAIEAWFAKPASESETRPAKSWFWRGLIVNVLNPKAAAVYVTLIPAALSPGVDRVNETLWLSAIYVAIATIVHLSIVAFAGLLTRFTQAPARRQLVQRSFAILMLGVAVWVAIATAPAGSAQGPEIFGRSSRQPAASADSSGV